MIDLPSIPAPNGAAPVYIDFGSEIEPLSGAPSQRIDRLGNRFGLAVSYPPMPNDSSGRIFISRLIRGKVEGVRMKYPLLDFNPGNPGSPVVDGADQGGRVLSVRGCAAGYTFLEGQPFSIEQNGQHYLYFVDVQASASAGGDVSLTISPMLRVPTLDGAVCHFAQPMIEGSVVGDDFRWNISLARHVGIEFEIRERA